MGGIPVSRDEAERPRRSKGDKAEVQSSRESCVAREGLMVGPGSGPGIRRIRQRAGLGPGWTGIVFCRRGEKQG